MTIAIQHHCVHCKREQYSPAVWDISNGDEACPWCGERSKPMTQEEFEIALREDAANEHR